MSETHPQGRIQEASKPHEPPQLVPLHVEEHLFCLPDEEQSSPFTTADHITADTDPPVNLLLYPSFTREQDPEIPPPPLPVEDIPLFSD